MCCWLALSPCDGLSAGNVLPGTERSRGEWGRSGDLSVLCAHHHHHHHQIYGRDTRDEKLQWERMRLHLHPARSSSSSVVGAGQAKKERKMYHTICRAQRGSGWHGWKILAWQSPTSLTLLAKRSFFPLSLCLPSRKETQVFQYLGDLSWVIIYPFVRIILLFSLSLSLSLSRRITKSTRKGHMNITGARLLGGWIWIYNIYMCSRVPGCLSFFVVLLSLMFVVGSVRSFNVSVGDLGQRCWRPIVKTQNELDPFDIIAFCRLLVSVVVVVVAFHSSSSSPFGRVLLFCRK